MTISKARATGRTRPCRCKLKAGSKSASSLDMRAPVALCCEFMSSRHLPVFLFVAVAACTNHADEDAARLERIAALEEQWIVMRDRVDALEERMATSQLTVEEGTVELPRARSGEEVETMSMLVVLESSLVLDGEVVAEADLDDTLRARARADPDAALVIQADASVSHARVVELLDRAKSAGLTRLSLATARPPG